MVKHIDLVGQRFNRLIVIKYIGNSKWLCKCDCGNQTIVNTQKLKSGHTKSCGCLKSEKSAETGRKIIYKARLQAAYNKRKYKNIPLGTIQSRLARIYNGMIERCYNKTSKRYLQWGGRGIKVCEEWKNNFESFYQWAVNNGFNENKKWYECSIDRINNNGDYEPSNCRWTTAKQQARNTRKNVLIKYNNEVHCISEWAEIKNINYSTLYKRIKNGWSIEKALS